METESRFVVASGRGGRNGGAIARWVSIRVMKKFWAR